MEKEQINKGVLIGNMLNETGFAREKQAKEDAQVLDEGGALKEMELAVRNSALGTLGATIGNQLLIKRADLPEDPQFKAGLFERIRADLPDVTDTEQDQLMGVGNVHEYNLLVGAAKRRRTEQRLASQSGLATGMELVLDVLPELAGAVRLTGALSKVAGTGTRLGLAVGGNAALGGFYEAARQRMSLEQTSASEVAQATIISGAVGGLFDSGFKYGQAAVKARTLMKDQIAALKTGGKAEADNVADDVAEAVSKQADEAVQAAAGQVDEAAAVAKADASPAIKEMFDDVTGTGAKQVAELEAIRTAARSIDLESAGPMQKAFLDLQDKVDALQPGAAAKAVETQAAPVAGEAAQAVDTQAARVTMDAAEQARVQDVMKDLESVPVKTVAEAAWDGVPVLSNVSEVESKAAPAMTTGRLRLRVGSFNSKPIFESPIDRALATLGSKVADDDLLAQAYETLQKAFPDEDMDTLVSMAHDYTDKMLMPHLRTAKSGAPKVARFWDKMDVAKYRDGYDQSVKELNAVLKEFTAVDGPAAASMIAKHASDADGAILGAAVAKANKMVTNQTVASGFKFLQKSNKALAETMNTRIAAFKELHGVSPDLRTVRTIMAKELYGRAVFDKQVVAKAGKQAGFISPKMLFVLGGGALLSMTMVNDAEAATGVSSASGALTAILAGSGGALLLGGKAMKQVLAARGAFSKKVAEGMDTAKRMKAQGSTDEAIEEATSFKVVDGNLYYKAEPSLFPEIADEASLTSEHLDEVVSASAKVATRDGEPVKVLMHYDGEKVIKTLEDLDKAPVIKTEVPLWGGKKQRVKVPDVLSAARSDSANLADDASPLARGLSMILASNIVPRLGRKAMEMAADHLYKSIKVGAMGRAELAFKTEMGAWYKETGRKKPNAIKNLWEYPVERKAFGEEIARAKEFPDDTTVSEAARNVAAEMARIEADTLGRIKNLVNEMQARGITFADDNPLMLASKLDPQADYVSRLVNKDKLDAVEKAIGRSGVTTLIKNGFKSANTGVPESKLDEIAEGIYATLNRVTSNTGVYVTRNQAAELFVQMKNAGLDDGTIQTVTNMLGIREQGFKPGVLNQRRMNIDLKVSQTFKVDGKDVSYSLADIYERDAMSLFGRWMDSMAGLEAMGTAGAQHGINLTDDGMWDTLVAKMKDQGADPKNLQKLQAYRSLMLGRERDVEVFGVGSSFERAVRTMGTFWLSQNFVLAQAGDIGGMGTRATKGLFKGMKASWELGKAIRAGELSKDDLRFFQEWMNAGLDGVSATTATAYETGADVGASLAERATHWSFKLSGMPYVANSVRATKFYELSDFMARYASGEAVDESLFKHYATMGLDKAVADQLAPFVRKNLVADPETGLFKGIDKKGWMAEDMLSARRFEMILQKAGDAANATPSGYGETAAALRSTMAGRFLSQLQSTALFITQRTQGEIYNFDAHVLNAWITSMVFSAGSYMARVGLRYGNDDEELEKRLSYEQIFLASVRNSSFAGVGPNVIDAMLSYSGIMPGGVFAGATNSGRQGGGELAIQAAVKTPIQAVAGLVGLAKFDPYNSYTQAEAMALQRTIAPIWWLQPMMTFVTKDLATKNPKRPAEEPADGPFN